MQKEIRNVFYDNDLEIETYHFKGLQQKFPNHTGTHANIKFTENVINNSDLYQTIIQLGQLLLEEHDILEKEELYFWFLSQLFSKYSSSNVEKDLNFHFEEVVNYINENYNHKITLNILASISFLSKYHFLRLFTKKFGISPYSYLQIIRINKAKELIKVNTPLNEIPYITGFSDQSHFTSFFKRFSGITPAQYRKIFHNKTIKD